MPVDFKPALVASLSMDDIMDLIRKEGTRRAGGGHVECELGGSVEDDTLTARILVQPKMKGDETYTPALPPTCPGIGLSKAVSD